MKWAPTLEFLNGPYHGDFKVTICKLDPKIKVKIFWILNFEFSLKIPLYLAHLLDFDVGYSQSKKFIYIWNFIEQVCEWNKLIFYWLKTIKMI